MRFCGNLARLSLRLRFEIHGKILGSQAALSHRMLLVKSGSNCIAPCFWNSPYLWTHILIESLLGSDFDQVFGVRIKSVIHAEKIFGWEIFREFLNWIRHLLFIVALLLRLLLKGSLLFEEFGAFDYTFVEKNLEFVVNFTIVTQILDSWKYIRSHQRRIAFFFELSKLFLTNFRANFGGIWVNFCKIGFVT